MKSFLLIFGLGSAALYMLLVIADNVIANGMAENALVGQTRANHPVVRRLSCWGPYLPSRFRGQERQVLTSAQQPTPRQQNPIERTSSPDGQPASGDKSTALEIDGADQDAVGGARVVLAARVRSEGTVTSPKLQYGFLISSAAPMPLMTESQTLGLQSVAVRSTLIVPDDPQTVTSPWDDDQIGTHGSHPNAGDTFKPSVPSEGGEAIWFVVSRAARLHAGPSVSSAIVHFYPVGTELKLIGHEQGWFHVSDPATSRQGWIYDKYYLEAIRGPGQTQVAVQASPSSARVALATPEPKPVSRVKKSQQKIAKPRPQPGKGIRLASARIQGESFASLVERAFRGY